MSNKAGLWAVYTVYTVYTALPKKSELKWFHFWPGDGAVM